MLFAWRVSQLHPLAAVTKGLWEVEIASQHIDPFDITRKPGKTVCLVIRFCIGLLVEPIAKDRTNSRGQTLCIHPILERTNPSWQLPFGSQPRAPCKFEPKENHTSRRETKLSTAISFPVRPTLPVSTTNQSPVSTSRSSCTPLLTP